MRLYEMFIGDFEKSAPWSSASIKGCKRFLDRVWALQKHCAPGERYSPVLESLIHKTIKKVSEDIETLKYNTAIAALMTLQNAITEAKTLNQADFKTFLILLNPFAPHITEECWQMLEFGGMITEARWPRYDPQKCKEDTCEIVLQISGKIKAKMMVPTDAGKDEMLRLARENPEISVLLSGKSIINEIAVPGKLVNFVVR
jgi:leucyl-tRNA synthetase